MEIGRIPGSGVISDDEVRIDSLEFPVRTYHEVVNHRGPVLHPLLEILAVCVFLPPVSVRVIPGKNILREILHGHSRILLKLPSGKLAEIGCYLVVAQTIEDNAVHLRIFLSEFLQYVNLILLHFRVGGVEHPVVVRLDFGNRRETALVIADRLPGSLVPVDDSAVEVIVSPGEDVEGAEDLQAELMPVVQEISEHIIVPAAGHPIPVSHIRSDLAVIEHFSHYGLHIYDDIAETEVTAFLQVELNGVRR